MRQIVAMALTWDGARWPVKSLPPKARAFLAGPVTPVREATRLLARDLVREIRVCWVPRLKGGDAVLANPLPTPDGIRMSFRTSRTRRFGDILGVVYRRA